MRLCLLGVFLLFCTTEEATLSKIGVVEFYGLKEVRRESVVSVVGITRGDWVPVNFNPGPAEKEVREAFGIPEGSPLPQNEREIVRRIKAVKGVHDAKLAAICCEPDGTTTLFVGIQENSEAMFQYRKPGDKQIALPPGVMSVYDSWLEAVSDAVRKGRVQEDDSMGHALFADEALQKFTREFIEYARDQTPLLAQVLNESADVRQRIAAAWIIGYGADKKLIAGELLKAIQDENEQVRNNATRSLAPIIALAQRDPRSGIQVDAAPFIRMLHSLSWSDRNKAMMVLLALTKTRPPQVLSALRAGALEPLIEMANWEDSHNRIALRLLGRLAGISDADADDLKNRQMVIDRAR